MKDIAVIIVSIVMAIFFTGSLGDELSIAQPVPDTQDVQDVQDDQDQDDQDQQDPAIVESHYFYDQLTPDEQTAYEEILASVQSGKEDPISFSTTIDKDQIQKISMSVYYDHGYELFWWDSPYNFRYDGNNIITEYTPDFNKLADDEATLQDSKVKFEAAVQSYLDGAAGMSDEEKIKYFHDRMVDETEYVKSDLDQSPYSTFILKETVCNGYALAMQHLLLKSGITCYYCTGTCKDYKTGKQVAHAWDIVEVGGQYKNLDVTWDDTGVTNDYYLVSDSALGHIRSDDGKLLPECN